MQGIIRIQEFIIRQELKSIQEIIITGNKVSVAL